MLILRKEQMDAMANAMQKNFLFRSLSVLERKSEIWSRDRTDDEKRKFVEDMVEFAHGNEIFKEMNIQKLMVWKLEHDYAIPLTAYLSFILNRPAFYEEYRLEQFLRAITMNHECTVITLDGE